MRIFVKSSNGFTLIELMLSVAVVAVLAAVAIPQYMSYVRRSYLSEATAAISAIKSAEEAYLQANSCYVDASAWPATASITAASGKKINWDPAPAGTAWSKAPMDVRPDRQVRFSYQVYSSNQYAAAGCGAANGRPTQIPPAGAACATSVDTNLIPAAIFPTNWYIVTALADFDGDGTFHTMVSAIDDTNIITCNDLD